MENFNITKRFLITSIILLVLVVPVCAWISAATYTNQKATVQTTPPEKDHLVSLIRAYMEQRNESNTDSVEYVSSERFNTNWYLVKIHEQHDKSIVYNVIVADFKEPQIVLGPGEVLSQLNISSIGIPYELIDKLYTGDGGEGTQ
jgi:hypothetical protein